MAGKWTTIEGNEAAASVAYRLSEVMAIYPITPSTPMGEAADAWSAVAKPNLWGTVPTVVEMQSEGGAAGAIHGALQTGALASTFTASQGLLLMIPNMYKIAGELTPIVFHVAARSLAAQALSIFGDHSDVMAARSTGFAMLASSNVQEAHDLALVAHIASLNSRIPFLHFFDGFRTSHEINKIQQLDDDDLRALIDDEAILAHRSRALSPEHPVIRGTAHNPDVAFQARESVNPHYLTCPAKVQSAMDALAARTGRRYELFAYAGAPDAERVIVLMGSGAETAAETARYLAERGERVGVVTVHLYRPFSVASILAALPRTTRSIAVLDRTKEPGSAGEPLYLDVVAALAEQDDTPDRLSPRLIGGRYGLSSKEFTPAMVKAVFDELSKETPRRHFTVGIDDDVTHTSLTYDPAFSIEAEDTARCVFWGLGSDGTVGANKNSIKIIGEQTPAHAQGYFVYDSKKSGSVTTSHLRFGPSPIRAPYLISTANFVACHQFSLLARFDVLREAAPGAVFLLNSPYDSEHVWTHLPAETRRTIRERRLRFYVIDASRVARECGMPGRINAVMQTCFFALSGVLPRDEAIAEIKQAIAKTYGKRGEEVVHRNWAAVDQALERLEAVSAPDHDDESAAVAAPGNGASPLLCEEPSFVTNVLRPMMLGLGDTLPVSAMPDDGTFPTGTARWEKRNLADEIPVWDPEICIQCGKCTLVCPHAAIRMKVYEPGALDGAPEGFLSAPARFKEFVDYRYTLQVAPEDCTSCGLCVEACPVKDKRAAGRRAVNMAPQPPLLERERANFAFFADTLPEVDTTQLNLTAIKNAQLAEPLFEFSGACSGCGETPYLKLLTQLFGDHLLIANATGCSSIYGGNLPTTPWSANRAGQGPAWANSLFEDNAEFGLGMRVTIDQQEGFARELIERLTPAVINPELAAGLLTADQRSSVGIHDQRKRVASLKQLLEAALTGPLSDEVRAAARQLLSLANALIRVSVWIVGGDGWAYDIGYGGLDHVLASGRNVKVLVMDTEVYSNTGGQASKSTPRGAVAKFAASGKVTRKKDLGQLAMTYGNIYVAQVAMGGGDAQTLHALLEAEAYDGPALIIAYSHCIAHGIDMRRGLDQQKLAVQSGYWPLYRFNPALEAQGRNPLILDSKEPTVPLEQFAYNEVRYRILRQADPDRASRLMAQAEDDDKRRWLRYQQIAATPVESEAAPTGPADS